MRSVTVVLMSAGHRTGAVVLGAAAALTLLAPPAPAAARPRSFRCAVSAEEYGAIVASGIKPIPPPPSGGGAAAASCAVGDAVAAQAAFRITLGHAAGSGSPYPTSLKLTLNRPGGVDATETWRYSISYPVPGRMHGFAIARCAGQRVTFTLAPHTPKVVDAPV